MEQPFPDTVQQAPVVARGHLGSSRSDWGKAGDGSKRIYTFTEFSVDETLKGPPLGRSIWVRQLGGEKDGVGMQIAGSAQLESGEDVVLLMGNVNSDASHDVWGLMMGKLTIARDTKGRDILKGPALKDGHGDRHDHEMRGTKRLVANLTPKNVVGGL